MTDATRVFTATLVAVVLPETGGGVGEAIAALAPAGVRGVIVSLGEDSEPAQRDENGITVIDGLLPRYLDNAVSSLRLSSLPTLAWWRATDESVLKDLAGLVDRVILDVDRPDREWSLVPDLAAITAVSDLRWTRLTRWRELLAQCFDIPGVRNAAPTFTRAEIAGADEYQVRLAGGWLRSRLAAGEQLRVDARMEGSSALESLRLLAADRSLAVRRLPNGTCLETVLELPDAGASRRVVAAGDASLETLIAEELRVRSRDLAFEDAVKAAEQS
jgi:glucose-6-phosphate dehydrogenase assembly protein OpcA